MAPKAPRPTTVTPAVQRLLREGLQTHRRFLAVLKQLATHVSATPPAGIARLTLTERELIHRIVATDEKLDAIRMDLGMGERTFDTHLNNIYQKLGVRKRSGLVREALRWGVV